MFDKYSHFIKWKIVFLIHVLDEVDYSSSIHFTVPGIPVDANREEALWNLEKMAWKEAIKYDTSTDLKTHHSGSQPLQYKRVPLNNRVFKQRRV